MYLDLLSLLTQATQEVSLYLTEDLSMLCSVYLLLEVLVLVSEELVLVSEELVSTLISPTLEEPVPDTVLVLEVPVDSCSTES